MGVGNFFGMLPDSMLGSRLYGCLLYTSSQKGDIDADQVIGREAFVGFMMENPADYYYGVLDVYKRQERRGIVNMDSYVNRKSRKP